MTACPDETELALLAEGALDDRDRVEHHLDRCAACSDLVAELARLVVPEQPALARYQIIRWLGAGAMGVVWEAYDRQLRRRVALKWVRPGGLIDDGQRRARLLREARALAQLRHPNVIAVHDVGEAGDQLYLALELLAGTTARGWQATAHPLLQPGRRTTAEILGVWRQVGAGLAAVHRAGIVHRDVKPDNVLVGDDGRVVLGDFGLATGELDALTTTLTATGQMIGTPMYMAPEQLRGEPATARSDQYAFCVCVWEALTGERPFRAGTIVELALATARRPALPSGHDRRVLSALARGLDPDPAKRWPDLEHLGVALDARPPRWKVAVLAIAAVLAAGVAGFARYCSR
jgi:serine/threonine protein kinase